jgi:hypothetical protein
MLCKKWLNRFYHSSGGLIASFSTRRPMFNQMALHVGFVIDKVEFGKTFLLILYFCLSTIILKMQCSMYCTRIRCHRRTVRSQHQAHDHLLFYWNTGSSALLNNLRNSLAYLNSISLPVQGCGWSYCPWESSLHVHNVHTATCQFKCYASSESLLGWVGLTVLQLSAFPAPLLIKYATCVMQCHSHTNAQHDSWHVFIHCCDWLLTYLSCMHPSCLGMA